MFFGVLDANRLPTRRVGTRLRNGRGSADLDRGWLRMMAGTGDAAGGRRRCAPRTVQSRSNSGTSTSFRRLSTILSRSVSVAVLAVAGVKNPPGVLTRVTKSLPALSFAIVGPP